MAEETKKSKIWQYFENINDNKAKCLICGKELSYKGGGTFNLIRHTTTQHHTVFHATVTVNESEKITPDTDSTDGFDEKPDLSLLSSQLVSPKVTQYLNKPISTKKYEQLSRYLVDLVTKQYLPLDIVESKELKQFIKELNPHYQIPLRNTLSEELLTSYYNITRENVEILIQQAGHLSITVDYWTSSPDENYLTLTAHFLNMKTELTKCMLDCYQYSDTQHTAESLSQEMQKICDYWDISDRIVAVTTDNDENVEAAIHLNKWKQIPCFANAINRIVQAGLQEINTTHSKIRAIVELFRNSQLASDTLEYVQKQLREHQLKLKQDIASCWNSTFELFERVLLIKKSLISTIAQSYPERDNITTEDVVVLTSATELLSYFKDVTEEMTSEKSVTISEVILISNALRKQCNNFLKTDKLPQPVQRMAQSLLNGLNRHFNDIELNNIFAESTILDPRFKKYGFSNEQSFQRASSNLKTLVRNADAGNVKREEELDICDEPSSSKKARTIWADFDKQVSQIISSSNPTAVALTEVEKYLQEVPIPRNRDPLKWWHEKKDAYPRLYEIVKERFCIVASSVPSERIFSKSGQMLVKRRNCLSGGKVPQIMFLSSNM